MIKKITFLKSYIFFVCEVLFSNHFQLHYSSSFSLCHLHRNSHTTDLTHLCVSSRPWLTLPPPIASSRRRLLSLILTSWSLISKPVNMHDTMHVCVYTSRPFFSVVLKAQVMDEAGWRFMEQRPLCSK